MKWFITGGSGLLGGFLIEQLLERGDEVVNYDIQRVGTLRYRKVAHVANYTFIDGDIMDHTQTFDAVTGHKPDIVVHLAAQSGVDQARDTRMASAMLNVLGTLNVLEAAYIARVPNVITASTNHIYGPQPFIIPSPAHQEDMAPLNERNWYTATKIAADVLSQAWAYNYDLNVVTIRPTNAFGPGDPHHDHIVPSTILNVLRGEAPIIRHTGKTKKAYMHAADTASGIVAVAENMNTFRGEAVNIVANKPIVVRKLVQRILDLMESPLEPIVQNNPYMGHDEALSGAKLQAVGWEPKHSLDEALTETIAFYREQARTEPVKVA